MAVNDILTLEEARQALDVTQTFEHDDEIPQYITAVSDRLDGLIGPIVQRTYTEKHDGGEMYIFLRHYPVREITSLKEDGVSLTLDSDYFVDPYSVGYFESTLLSNRVERAGPPGMACAPCGRWRAGRRNIEVTYTAGRATDTASVPQLYKTTAALILANFWRSQQDSSGGMGEFAVPQSFFPRWAIPQAARQLIENEIQEPRLFVK